MNTQTRACVLNLRGEGAIWNFGFPQLRWPRLFLGSLSRDSEALTSHGLDLAEERGRLDRPGSTPSRQTSLPLS